MTEYIIAAGLLVGGIGLMLFVAGARISRRST